MFGTFNDIAVDADANEEACKFIRRKIAETVKDPETARKLTPTDLYARRPLCDSGYYEIFNRSNVSLVDCKATPITEIKPNGIVTADGTLHELDMIIFATGFDAVDGNYKVMDLRGRNGQTMKDHWQDGATGFMGTMTAGFPNMFMVLGPHGPFSNLPPAIEMLGVPSPLKSTAAAIALRSVSAEIEPAMLTAPLPAPPITKPDTWPGFATSRPPLPTEKPEANSSAHEMPRTFAVFASAAVLPRTIFAPAPPLTDRPVPTSLAFTVSVAPRFTTESTFAR
jgi:hypothetical protein